MTDAIHRWSTETSVTMQRHHFERILRYLSSDLERLAAIRAAYDATLDEAKQILAALRIRGVL